MTFGVANTFQYDHTLMLVLVWQSYILLRIDEERERDQRPRIPTGCEKSERGLACANANTERESEESRRVDVRLPGKENSNSRGARLVYAFR